MTLADQISKNRGQPATVRIGTVITTVPLIVDVQGTFVERAGVLNSYFPVIGDVVALLGQSAVSADGSSWLVLGQVDSSLTPGLGGAWLDWSPTLTNLTVGTGGFLLARYRQFGKTVHYRFKFRFGAGSAVGTGPRFTLPVPLHATYVVDEDRLGSGQLLDSGIALRDAIGYMIATDTVLIGAFNATGTKTDVTAAAPWAWGTNDTIMMAGTYEAA